MHPTSVLGQILSRKKINLTRRQISAYRKKWQMIRRADQTPPADNFWDIWIYAAGRGAGKTRVGAEETVAFAEANPGTRLLLVAPNFSHLRETMIEGESGIFSVYEKSGREDEAPEYKPSVRRLTWPNGSQALLMTADEPDSLRGPQAHFAWVDEAASFAVPEESTGKLSALDNIRLCTRLGYSPRIVITTTPRKTEALKQLHTWLVHDPVGIRLTDAVYTTDNEDNLARAYLDGIQHVYGNAEETDAEIYGEWPWRL